MWDAPTHTIFAKSQVYFYICDHLLDTWFIIARFSSKFFSLDDHFLRVEAVEFLRH